MTNNIQNGVKDSTIKKVFNAPVDGEFDNLARLASNVLNVPFVLISLSCGGAKAANAYPFNTTQNENPEPEVAISVSSNAFLPEDLVRKHPDVIKSALSESDDLNFYATAPLMTAKGNHLGTLYAFDHNSDLWGNVHWEILDNIASIITGQLEVKIAAQEIIRSQQDMAYRMSHDFRGAVCNIPVLVKMIRDENKDPEKQKALGNMIVKAAEKGLGAVEKFYAHSRTQADTVSAEKTQLNLSDLTRKAASAHRPIAARKRLQINMLIEPNIQIPGNTKNLNKLLDNLLGNAIKFSFPDQTVDVILVKSKAYILLEVRDEGIGMSKSEIADAMQKVESLSDRNEEKEDGTGLGLWMVNEIAHEHEGKISIKSRGKNKGTTVTVMLPNHTGQNAYKPETRASRHHHTAEYQKKNVKITNNQINSTL